MKAASHAPKLSVITSVRLLSMMYSSDRSTPSVVLVEAETTKLIVALVAMAPDQVTSSVASTCSPRLKNPGSGPFTVMIGKFAGTLKAL